MDLDQFPQGLLIGPNMDIGLAARSRKACRRLARLFRGKRASANLLVDLGGTAQLGPTLPPAGTSLSPSGQLCGLSGTVIGAAVDLLYANTFCNVLVQGLAASVSGPLVLQVQTSDTDVSGNYTDPTSGLAQMPTYFTSGGLITLNSGGGANSSGGTWGMFVSGQAVASGFTVSAAFQRNARYARVNFYSGNGTLNQYVGSLSASFVSQQKTTGSGGGFSYSPGSGIVNV